MEVVNERDYLEEENSVRGTLRNEIARLKNKLQLSNNVEKDLQDEIRSQKLELTKLTDDLYEKNKSIKLLEDKLKLATEQITIGKCDDNCEVFYGSEHDAFIRSKLSEVQDKLKKEEKAVDRLENQNLELKVLVDDYEQEAAKFQAYIKKLELENTELRKECNSAVQEKLLHLQDLRKKDELIEELGKHCSELKEIIDITKAHDSFSNADSFTLNTKFNETFNAGNKFHGEDLGSQMLDIQLKETVNQLAVLQEANDNLNIELRSVLSKLSAYDEENEKLKAENKRLTKELDLKGQQHIENLQSETHKVARETKIELQNRYSAKFDVAKKQLKSFFVNELKEKDASIQSLKENVETLTRERAMLRAGNVELNNTIYELREKQNKSKEEIEKLKESLRGPRGQVSLRHNYDAFAEPNFHRKAECNIERSDSISSIGSAISNSSVSGRPKLVPFGSGTLFTCDDEDEQFQFSEKNLIKLKNDCFVTDPDPDRLHEIQRRNTLVPPHMRSCYPAEFQFFDSHLDEENIRASHISLPETFKRTTNQKQHHTNSKPFTEITNRQRNAEAFRNNLSGKK